MVIEAYVEALERKVLTYHTSEGCKSRERIWAAGS